MSSDPSKAIYPVLAVALLLGFLLLQRYQFIRIYRGQPSLGSSHRYAFSPTGLAAESSHGRGEVDWSAFTKWRENPSLFLLYQADNLFHIIPKRWFEGDDAAVEQFRSLLKSTALRRID